MKRRDFIINGFLGSAGISAAGCSSFVRKKYEVTTRFATHSFEVTHPKPSGGTIETKELGSSGIKVSSFGYGAHMPTELVPFEEERCTMIRGAHELGVSVFDIYDHWGVEQFEPMSRHLKPIMNDVILSLNMQLLKGRTCDQEFERALRLFNRDYIDMYRLNANASSPENKRNSWQYWDKLFQFKEQGKIRAVGMSIHYPHEPELVLKTYPLDYVILPFNFYHNLLHSGDLSGDYHPLMKELRKKGVGIVVMKPFATDWFVQPLIEVAQQIDETGEISLPRAMLRYVINSYVEPDIILGGMFNLDHVYEDVPAFYQTEISSEEKRLLKKLRKVTRINFQKQPKSSDRVLNIRMPRHYQFLEHWAAHTDDTEQIS